MINRKEIFMETITTFLATLPPLLQLLCGVFLVIGALKIFMMVVDFIEDRKDEKS